MSDTPKANMLTRVKDALQERALTLNERAVLAFVMLRAGTYGEVKLGHEEIATALGISTRQSERITDELHRAHMLRRIRQGNRRPNLYRFEWHPEFPEATSVSHQDCASEATSMSDQTSECTDIHVAPEATSMSVLYKERLLKTFSEEEEDESGASLSQTHTAEEIRNFGQFMKELLEQAKQADYRSRHRSAFGVDFTETEPREQLVRDVLGLAPTWTAAECAYAIQVNLSENPSRPKSYAWFKPTLADVYKRYDSKAPELPKPKPSGPNPKLVIRDETPEERQARFEEGNRLREQIRRGQERHEAAVKLRVEQGERWKRLYAAQPPHIRKRMDKLTACDETYGDVPFSVASANSRESALRALEDGTHEIFRKPEHAATATGAAEAVAV